MEQENNSIEEEKTPQEPITLRPIKLSQLKPVEAPEDKANIEMLLDVNLSISVELGRTQKSLGEILKYGPGSIIELNKLAGEPVDILINDKVVATGEVVVIDENFAVRISSLIGKEERLESLKKE